jgi:creatinine amidohydrolase/Fe(II)-dependent formamide hydrolase-like protein
VNAILATRQDIVAVLPVAAYENHGILPLETDILIGECICKHASSKCNGKLKLMPPIPYSVSIEHSAPRVTVSPPTFLEYLHDVIFDASRIYGKLIVAVFHGGAFHTTFTAVRMVRSKTGSLIGLFNFWECVENVLRKDYNLSYSLIHADPVEASILLACGHNRGVREVGVAKVLDILKSMSRKRRLIFRPWIYSDIEDLYPYEPVAASKELGEKIVARCSEELCRLASILLGGTSNNYLR